VLSGTSDNHLTGICCRTVTGRVHFGWIVAKNTNRLRNSFVAGAIVGLLIAIIAGLPAWWDRYQGSLWQLAITWTVLVGMWYVGGVVDRKLITDKIHYRTVFLFIFFTVLVFWRPVAFFGSLLLYTDLWPQMVVYGAIVGLCLSLILAVAQSRSLAGFSERRVWQSYLGAIIVGGLTLTVVDTLLFEGRGSLRILAANVSLVSAIVTGIGLSSFRRDFSLRVLCGCLGGLLGTFAYWHILGRLPLLAWLTAAGWAEFVFCGRSILGCPDESTLEAYYITGAAIGGALAISISLVPHHAHLQRWSNSLILIVAGSMGIIVLTFIVFVSSEFLWVLDIVSITAAVILGGAFGAGIAVGRRLMVVKQLDS